MGVSMTNENKAIFLNGQKIHREIKEFDFDCTLRPHAYKKTFFKGKKYRRRNIEKAYYKIEKKQKQDTFDAFEKLRFTIKATANSLTKLFDFGKI